MQAFGYGNNTESEVLFGREKYFEVTKLTFAEDGTPTVYMKEVMKSGEADKGGETGIGDYRGRMPRGTGEGNASGGNISDLQRVQETGTRKVQRASDGNSAGNPVQQGSVPDVRAEVTAKTEQAAQEFVNEDLYDFGLF